jgi:hypothetical protein
MYTAFTVQVYQTSQYAVSRGGIFLGKWRSSFAESSDGKINIQSACAVNTRYNVRRSSDYSTLTRLQPWYFFLCSLSVSFLLPSRFVSYFSAA